MGRTRESVERAEMMQVTSLIILNYVELDVHRSRLSAPLTAACTTDTRPLTAITVSPVAVWPTQDRTMPATERDKMTHAAIMYSSGRRP